MTSKINRKLVTEQKQNSRPFTRPYKRIVSRYVTFELFSRPPSPIFPCTLVSMQSIKNVRRVTLVKSLQQRETEQKS